MRSTHISDDDRKKYDTVLGKFDEFFQVRKNVIFERARFNRRHQLQDETSEQYITALYHLVENCAYGDLKDEMICNRVVVGIRDTTLSERLQMDADLTLDKAKKSVRQREAVHEQQEILNPELSTNHLQHWTLCSTNSAKVPITGENTPYRNQTIACGHFASHLDHQRVVKSAFGVGEVLILEQSAQLAKLFATSAKI